MNDQARDQATYLVGYALAAILTAGAFLAVVSEWLASQVALFVVAILGGAQLLVHLRCFLHIDLSRQKREDLQLILFSALLLVIMTGGTLWIMGNLAKHMG